MTDPLNWLGEALAYAVMVTWGASLTARLTQHWRDSVQDLNQAEDATLREREVVAKVQRQQSITQLSGGVAHDFNNILAVITLNLEVARELSQHFTGNEEDLESFDETLKDALDAAERGAGLTQR